MKKFFQNTMVALSVLGFAAGSQMAEAKHTGGASHSHANHAAVAHAKPRQLSLASGNVKTGNVTTGNNNKGNINTGGVKTGKGKGTSVLSGNVQTGNVKTGNNNKGNINTGNVTTGGKGKPGKGTGKGTGNTKTGDVTVGDNNSGNINTGTINNVKNINIGGGGGFGGGGFGGGAGGGFSDGGAVVAAPAVIDAAPVLAAAPAPAALPDLRPINIQMVDAGSAEENLGPRYRVTVLNDSTTNVNQEFAVAVLGSDKPQASAGLPGGVKRVNGLNAGQTTTVDVRLPMGTAFSYLVVAVDAQNEVQDAQPNNNLAILAKDAVAAR